MDLKQVLKWIAGIAANKLVTLLSVYLTYIGLTQSTAENFFFELILGLLGLIVSFIWSYLSRKGLALKDPGLFENKI